MKKSPFHYFFFFAIALSVMFLNGCVNSARRIPQLGKDPVKKVVAAMSLEEKAQIVVGTGMYFEVPDSIRSHIPENVRSMFNQKVPEGDSAYAAMVERIRKLVPGAAGRSAALSRYGISTMVLTDGPAGLRIQPRRINDQNTYFCTAFPIASLLASSWDTVLVNEVGKAMGNEVLEYGSDILLAPAMNIHRNPLCGRNFEYYSEDPLVSGKMAAAMVSGIQSEGVGTSVKHFAANNQETHRLSVNDVVSRRALREIYLKGFRIVVQEAHPWTVMSSYNKVNGTYTSESYDLLTNILRKDWGFKGFVMTDWGGGLNPVAQMKAGNDLLMPGNPMQSKAIIEAVKQDSLDEHVLDRNVERILNIVLKTPGFKKYQNSNKPDLKAHAEITRKAGAESMILLRNINRTLPLQNHIVKVAGFGNSTYESIIGGTGSGDVNEAYSVSIADGLKKAGKILNESLQETYLNYMAKTRAKMPPSKNWLANLMGAKMPVPEMPVNENLAGKIADEADMALISIGRNAGEGADREINGDFNLSVTEKMLIKHVADAFHEKGKKVVVILNIDGVIETVSWRDLPDAILLAYLPGQEAGNSITDVITGKVNPSGKLTSTFPVTYQDEPSAKNFPGKVLENPQEKDQQSSIASFMQRVPAEVIYGEDIYVGYRYFNTFKVPVAYEFGYGLSYTDFEYSNLKISAENFLDELTVSVDVKNTGDVFGREVVQIYIKAPDGKLEKPDEELRAFGKTAMLTPGDSQTLRFVLTADDLASFDEESSSWVAEPGAYEIRVGASSRDIRLKTSFNLDKELVVKQVTNALAPQKEIEKLHQ